jgi:hypothetical protein
MHHLGKTNKDHSNDELSMLLQALNALNLININVKAHWLIKKLSE